MQIDDIQNLFFMNIFKDIFQKNFSGDSPAFSVILESMSKALDEKNLYNPQGASILTNEFKEINQELKEINRNSSHENIPASIENAIKKASAKYGVEEKFIKAVIKQESSFNPYSKSSMGAMGLMQLMPGTARSLGVTDPYNIEQNVDGGTKYLKGMLESYGNCKEMALAAYNAGPNGVRRRNVKSPSDIYKMPRETRGYVDKVMKYYKGTL